MTIENKNLNQDKPKRDQASDQSSPAGRQSQKDQSQQERSGSRPQSNPSDRA